MNKNEIKEFIEQMEEVGDIWDEEQVERVYGKMSLKDALHDRKSAVSMLFDILGKAINHSSK